MSTTPRTDAAKNQYMTGKIGVFEVLNEARTLENELAHLNDEVERLKKDNLDMGHWIGSKMYEPEWDSFKKSLEIIDHWKARVKKTEAALDVMTTELGKMFLSAAERADRNVELRRRAEKAEADIARLDWLDENMGYSGGGSGGTYTFFTPADVECGMLRDAIDAAMKKASK